MNKFAIIGSMLLLVSCTQPITPEPEPAINNLHSAEKLLIKLPENHTDGCTWQLSDDFDKNIVKRDKEVWHGPDKGIYFYLETDQPGRTALHFVKRKYRDTLDKMTYIIAVSN